MSKYTTEVRYICENYAGLTESAGYDNVDEIVEAAAPYIFEKYPIFDELYRLGLNKKILRHFYTREIGSETVGLWKLWLNNKMNEIMPLYNQMYESTLLEFNPLYDVDVTTTHEGEDAGTAGRENTSSGRTDNNLTDTSETVDKYSDTPQGGLTGVENGTYLTNARITNGTNSNTGDVQTSDSSTESSDFSNTNSYIDHVVGKHGGMTYSKMIAEFRENMINVDNMIIDELNDLFMKLY